ncbi:MAG: T9SS type A sorting domain-containing protein [Candidatus Marinimicrobia bacterium]|nr:T9SS type A sorting domain-containing protein [Candidatus Neomarinimicrobiota bacterium]
MLQYFSEVYFDTSGWKIEIMNEFENIDNFDGWFLTSISDTGYIKSGIIPGTNPYVVLTQDSLLNPFTINALRDTLVIHTPDGYGVDWMFYGDIVNNQIIPPLPHQSLNRELLQLPTDFTDDFNYLDNTPTIGQGNDSLNAIGMIEGIVTDTLQNPLSGVKIFHDYEVLLGAYAESLFVYTDVSGYYSFNSLARVKHLQYDLLGFDRIREYVQVYPDSVLLINQEMVGMLQSTTDNLQNIPNHFSISSIYPNPFNSTTTIHYSIPYESEVRIRIYTVSGKLIEALKSERQMAGSYKLKYSFNDLSSGVYLIQLTSESVSISKKCVHLK